MLSHFSCVRLFATPWTIALQALLSMGFSMKSHERVGCHTLLQGVFLTQESNQHFLNLLNWQAGSLPLLLLGIPQIYTMLYVNYTSIKNWKKKPRNTWQHCCCCCC